MQGNLKTFDFLSFTWVHKLEFRDGLILPLLHNVGVFYFSAREDRSQKDTMAFQNSRPLYLIHNHSSCRPGLVMGWRILPITFLLVATI